ncbi:DegV domain-containing protein [Mesobacillus campisalis]|uniref:DegV domain-containing protein n=1 Tax=Mesobacillus campisalis TaxID=1408103 RepID=A0A0M2SXH2_9BACI|nr:DegV family protein [Mesobacillus campisalis]KKK37682.1 DegV domain-containing protein [Mesobacillus campisalis]
MNKIKVVTDSTVDLSENVIKEYDIHIVPLSISIDGEHFLDRIEISPQEFMDKMKASKELPKSSQPSAGEFLEVYESLADQGYSVISIHMTGGMSGTVRSAESAAGMTKADVTVIDSRFISKALAFQVIEAAKMAKEGRNIEDIVARLEQVRENTRLYVVVDTLENLVKGGRIGKGKAMIGSLLNIKPIASLEGGEYTPVSKARSYSQVVKYLVNRFVEDTEGRTVRGVGLVHAAGMELAAKLKEAIAEKTGYSEIQIEDTTPIVSTHTGPGAIGFMYFFE